MSVVNLNFSIGSVPEIAKGNMSMFVVMTRNKDGIESCFSAYYLNAHPLEYEDTCDKRGCPKDEEHEDGCPTTGWFYDESNFEYDHCYYAISADVIAYAALPSVEEVKAALGLVAP